MKKNLSKSKIKREFKLGKINDFWLSVIKGCMWAVSITLIAILLFAIIIRFTNLPDSFIMPINQIIKIFSIMLGCFLGAKVKPEKGLKMGFFIGLFYSISAFIIFSILSSSFSISTTLIIDTVFASVIGAICGVFAVNILSKK